MALRTKTLWYATRLTAASMADAVLTALPTITVYTENSSRTFRSVLAWLNFEGMSTVTGGTIGEHRLAVSVNGAGATTITELDDISNSGENITGRVGPFDFTSHFTTNYPAADSTTVAFSAYIDVSTGTGLTTDNISVVFCITYEYDDGAATQYNTAIIPMESDVSAMATTEDEIGTNQIPQLTGAGGLLENVAGVVVRQQFVIVEGNAEDAGGVTDFTMNTRIDTGTTITHNLSERALGSDGYQTFVHIESPSAGAVHAWKAWTTGSGAMNHAAHTLYVTYQWTVSGTTEFLNSIQLPFEIPSPMGGTVAGDTSRVEFPIRVEEPTTITLKQSAYRLSFVAGAAAVAGLNTRAGAQAFRAYTDGISVVCGGQCLQQRIDSGSAQGAGVTLARGKNTLTIDVYRTDATDLGWNVSGLVLLNYKSGVSGSGVGAHNHTTVWKIFDWDALLSSLREAAAVAPNLPETNYWVSGIGFEMIHWDAASANGIVFSAEVLSGEGAADGWRDLYADIFIKDAERSCQIIYCRARGDMKRWPNDTDLDRLAIETARKYRYGNAATCAKGVVMLLTYHAITFTISGTITGSAGGTVDIDLFTEDGDEILHIGSTSRSGNGVYSLTWYDSVYNCFAEAREDGTHVGRSDLGVAV